MSCADKGRDPGIRLGSKLTISNASEVKNSIIGNATDGEIVVDASEVETIDLAGLQLLAAISLPRPGGPRRWLAASSEQVDAALRRAGFPAPTTH